MGRNSNTCFARNNPSNIHASILQSGMDSNSLTNKRDMIKQQMIKRVMRFFKAVSILAKVIGVTPLIRARPDSTYQKVVHI